MIGNRPELKTYTYDNWIHDHLARFVIPIPKPEAGSADEKDYIFANDKNSKLLGKILEAIKSGMKNNKIIDIIDYFLTDLENITPAGPASLELVKRLKNALEDLQKINSMGNHMSLYMLTKSFYSRIETIIKNFDANINKYINPAQTSVQPR